MEAVKGIFKNQGFGGEWFAEFVVVDVDIEGIRI